LRDAEEARRVLEERLQQASAEASVAQDLRTQLEQQRQRETEVGEWCRRMEAYAEYLRGEEAEARSALERSRQQGAEASSATEALASVEARLRDAEEARRVLEERLQQAYAEASAAQDLRTQLELQQQRGTEVEDALRAQLQSEAAQAVALRGQCGALEEQVRASKEAQAAHAAPAAPTAPAGAPPFEAEQAAAEREALEAAFRAQMEQVQRDLSAKTMEAEGLRQQLTAAAAGPPPLVASDGAAGAGEQQDVQREQLLVQCRNLQLRLGSMEEEKQVMLQDMREHVLQLARENYDLKQQQQQHSQNQRVQQLQHVSDADGAQNGEAKAPEQSAMASAGGGLDTPTADSLAKAGASAGVVAGAAAGSPTSCRLSSPTATCERSTPSRT